MTKFTKKKKGGGIKRTHLNVIKAHLTDKSTANIILNRGNLKAFPLKSRMKQGCSLLTFLFNIGWNILYKAMREEK